MVQETVAYKVLRAGLFTVVSFVFVALFASVSSPFSDIWGIDYGTFRTMGLFWSNGGTIYRDMFDHKGPYLFLIQALACCISHSKWSIYALESLNLALCLWLLYDIGKLLITNRIRIYIALTAYLAFFALTIEWGNTVEEWSMPPVLLSLLLGIRYITRPQEVNVRAYAMVIGLCFGIVALMRLNNTAIIVGMVLGLSYLLIRQGEIKLLCWSIVWFIVGLSIGVLPMIVYFWSKGALYDMVYATFIFNFKYRHAWDHSLFNCVINGLRMLVCIVAVISACAYDKRHKSRSPHPTLPIVAPIAIISALTFIDGATYPHYFTMILPIGFLTVILCEALNKWLQAILTIVIIAPIARDWELQRRVSWIITNNKALEVNPAPQDLLTKVFTCIPADEYGDIYMMHPYLGYTDVLYHVGVSGPGKYIQQQCSYANIDDYARQDIITRFVEARPKWVISFRPFEETVLKPYSTDYTIVNQCEATGLFKITIRLYRRNEAK